MTKTDREKFETANKSKESLLTSKSTIDLKSISVCQNCSKNIHFKCSYDTCECSCNNLHQREGHNKQKQQKQQQEQSENM